MTGWTVVHIGKAAAATALNDAAFTGDDDRTTIHSFVGGNGILIGAEHDLADALELVGRANYVAWVTHPVGHDLAVLADGRVIYYDVERPERKKR